MVIQQKIFMNNPFSLEGKTLLVTGSSSNIGRKIAIRCAEMGAKVIVVARDEVCYILHVIILDIVVVGIIRVDHKPFGQRYVSSLQFYAGPLGDAALVEGVHPDVIFSILLAWIRTV